MYLLTDWDRIRLGVDSIAHIIMGQSPSSNTYNIEGKGLPFLQGKAEFGKIYPIPKNYCNEPIKIAEKNDILISVRAPVGDINISPYKCCIGRGLASIRPRKDKLNYVFLYYLLKIKKRQFEIVSTGSTFKAIKKENINNLIISLPPLPEQKKIAEILSTVDKAIEKVDEAIERTERLKRGLMQQLFTKGIGNIKYKKTAIGRISSAWEVVNISKLGTFQYGITTKTSSIDTGVKFIRVTDVTYTNVDWDHVPYCEISKSELEKYIVKKNDILFARIGATTGKTCLIEKDVKSVFGSYLLRFQSLSDLIDKRFLFYFTQSNKYWLQVNMCKGGQLKQGLNKSLLGNINIPLPPLSEQLMIIEILNMVDKRIELLIKKKARLEKIKKGLMNDLLTGRKRVKLEA